MVSIVIAAHDEAGVIGRTLDALLADAEPGELDVTVVANGCRDDTAAVAAARPGVRVAELAKAGKAAALNVGDSLAHGFPRIYLDADIIAPTSVVRAVVGVLEEGNGRWLAAYPARELDVSGRPVLVRAYLAVNRRLPAFRDGLFGRGMIVLSEQGRSRFSSFPEMVADDLFLDSLFLPGEKHQVEAVATTVAAPLETRALIRRLVRIRRGNAAMRATAGVGDVGTVRPTDRTGWLRDVVVPNPRLAPAAVVYVAISLLASVMARRESADGSGWGKDESTRGMHA